MPVCYGKSEYKRLIGSKAEAEVERQRIKRLIRLGEPLEAGGISSNLLGDLIEEARLAWPDRDPRRHYANLWAEWGGHMQVSAVTRPRIQEALRLLGEKFSPATVRICHSALRSVFSLAVEKGMLSVDRDPFYKRFKLEPANERSSPLEAEDILALLQEMGPRWAPYALFAILSGLRGGEMIGLSWEYVDLDRRFLKIPRPKQRKPHTEPLSDWMVEILLEQKALGSRWCFPGEDGERMSYNAFHWKWQVWYKDAMIYGRHTWHDLRHTSATLAASAGESLHAIGKMLGQGSPNTTRRYAHIVETAARGSVDAVAKSLGAVLEIEGN